MNESNDASDDPGDPTREAYFASRRRPDRTYVSKTFPFPFKASNDYKQPTRFVSKVFDPQTQLDVELSGEEWLISETPAGRFQVKLRLVREDGRVTQLWVQRMSPDGKKLETKWNLKEPELSVFLELIRNVGSIPIQGEDSVRVDDALMRDLFADPDALAEIYRKEPERLLELVTDDAAAREAVASKSRRDAVAEFERLYRDDAYFDAKAAELGRREAVWQQLFEDNPWLLGATLATQLCTSWSDERLEQIVTGSSIDGVGKRTDALLRTAGRIRSLFFVEIKTHQTELLAKGDPYRSGCFAPSAKLAGAVAQLQGTVHRAVQDIGLRLQSIDADGADIPGDFSYLIRPRAVLVIGDLAELQNDLGGDAQDRIRSMELYRRSLVEPEVVTFDELLQRARWVVDSGSSSASTNS